MYKDVTDKNTLPTCVVQRGGFELLHTILVTEPTVPVVLVPIVKPEPVSSSTHASGKPRAPTAGGPCVHIAQPWSLPSTLVPPEKIHFKHTHQWFV